MAEEKAFDDQETFPVAEVFAKVLELGVSLGALNISRLKGCWELQVDEHWWLAVNGHTDITQCSKDYPVAPYSVYVEFNGWPAGMFGLNGGNMVAGSLANEDNLIAAIEARIALEKANERKAAEAEDTPGPA